MAWYYDKDNNNQYEIYIGQVGGVKANPNSKKLFNHMVNVKEIDVTYLDTSDVTIMYTMFQHCDQMEKIVGLENLDTSKVTDMSGMFNYCSKLTLLDLSNFNTSQVTTMYAMFQNCINLTSLDLRNWDTSSVSDMSYMFTYTTNLKPIYVGENWKTASTATSMFGGTALTKSVDELCKPDSTQEWCILN